MTLILDDYLRYRTYRELRIKPEINMTRVENTILIFENIIPNIIVMCVTGKGNNYQNGIVDDDRNKG
jgi:hypothetical protein